MAAHCINYCPVSSCHYRRIIHSKCYLCPVVEVRGSVLRYCYRVSVNMLPNYDAMTQLTVYLLGHVQRDSHSLDARSGWSITMRMVRFLLPGIRTVEKLSEAVGTAFPVPRHGIYFKPVNRDKYMLTRDRLYVRFQAISSSTARS